MGLGLVEDSDGAVDKAEVRNSVKIKPDGGLGPGSEWLTGKQPQLVMELEASAYTVDVRVRVRVTRLGLELWGSKSFICEYKRVR